MEERRGDESHGTFHEASENTTATATATATEAHEQMYEGPNCARVRVCSVSMGSANLFCGRIKGKAAAPATRKSVHELALSIVRHKEPGLVYLSHAPSQSRHGEKGNKEGRRQKQAKGK